MHEDPTRHMGQPPPEPSGGRDPGPPSGFSPQARAIVAILVVAVIGLAIGLVVATGGDDEPTGSTVTETTTQEPTTTTQTETTTATTTTTATGEDGSGGTPAP